MSLQRREREIRKPLRMKSHTDTSHVSITLLSARLGALCRKRVMETPKFGEKKILCTKVFTLAWGSFRLVWMMGTHLLHKLSPEVMWRLSVFIYNEWKQWLIATATRVDRWGQNILRFHSWKNITVLNWPSSLSTGRLLILFPICSLHLLHVFFFFFYSHILIRPLNRRSLQKYLQ